MLNNNVMHDLYRAKILIKDIKAELSNTPWYHNELENIIDSISHVMQEAIKDRKDGYETNM